MPGTQTSARDDVGAEMLGMQRWNVPSVSKVVMIRISPPSTTDASPDSVSVPLSCAQCAVGSGLY